MDHTKPTRVAAPPSSRKRRRILPIIDARFQWKYTTIITLLGVSITAIMGGFLYKAHTDNTRLLDLGGSAELRAQVVRGDQLFLLYLFILIVAMGLALGIWGLIVTHRISGPVYLVARYLAVLARGQYPDMRPLRKRDELQEFFTAFENAVAALKARDAANLRDLDDAIAMAKKGLAASDSGPSRGALEMALAALERQRATLASSLGAGEGVAVD